MCWKCRQAAFTTSSLDTLGAKTTARGFEQTVSLDADLFAGAPRLTTLRGLLTIAAIHGNPVAFGDFHSAFHQSPMPSQSESQCQKDRWTLPKFGSARKLFKVSLFRHRLGAFTAHRKSTT